MRNAKALVVGAVTFIVLHMLFVAMWQAWFNDGGGLAPWFMNSTATVACTVFVFAAVGAVASTALAPAGKTVVAVPAALAALMATGGAVPMIVVLFTMRGGPGTLFPIAIVVGWLVLFVGAALGSGLTWLGVRRFDS